LVRLLRISGLTGESVRADGARPVDNAISIYVSEPGVPPRQSRHIGIWERKTENGKNCFVRRLDTMDTWHLWANLGRIDAKGSGLRVLFTGESVARGYLYDPSFTPAMALQMMLEGQYGKDQVEVIDLARTNLGYEIKDLALAALQLEPDVAIIFAGNNWGFAMPGFDEIVEIDSAIESEGMAGVKRVCDEYIAKRVKRMVREIAAEFKSSGIPLIWIIPESNLGDWREPFTNAPYLPANRNREWILTMKEARKALSEGNLAKAEELATRAVQLDEGTTAAGYRVLADSRRMENDPQGERKYREYARDAQSWDSAIGFIPKPYAFSQQILREELLEHDCQVVDLPVLFDQYLKGELPGVRMFLDYCHLTSEGIRVAMSHAASCVVRAIDGVEQPWCTLLNEHIAPSPEIEAEASFLAAIHSAHKHQGYDIVHHFCKRALEHSTHVAEIMLSYIDFQVRNEVPLRMSEAEQQIFRLSSPLVHRYLFQKNNEKWLDRILLTAMADALEDAGIPGRERLEQLYLEEHNTKRAETDLLHPFYFQSAGQPHELEALCRPLEHADTNARYFRAYWIDSKFIFVGEAGLPINLSLTCRLPRLSLDEGTISIDCNEKPQAEITIGKQWSAWDITIPGEAVRNGVNELQIHWPMPTEFRSSEALHDVVTRVCEMKYPEYYPIFGEVYTFTADGRPAPTHLPVVQAEPSMVQVT